MIGYAGIAVFVTLLGYVLGHRSGWRRGRASGYADGQEAVRIRTEQVNARMRRST